jgi:diacylglycerol kinase family enzyme
MRLAVVINVGHGAAALKHAVDTQTLLLDRLGTRLESIRLAAPRLLRQACLSAIAEKPDVLVVAGGPRSARRAGELAHKHDIPIVFLSGFGSRGWARHLWGSLSLESMISALAREDLRPVRLGVGMVGDQVFFEEARCGLFPHLPELYEALGEADTFEEGWHVLTRAAQLTHFLVSPNVRFGYGDSPPRRASALIIKPAALSEQIESWCERTPSLLRCSAFHYGLFGVFGALLRSGVGERWRRGRTEKFECATFLVEAGQPNWILLDGEPVRFEGRVEFRFIPAALQTFVFDPARRSSNDNHQNDVTRFWRAEAAPELERNFPAPSHVALPESRRSGYRIH